LKKHVDIDYALIVKILKRKWRSNNRNFWNTTNKEKG
jgi:hypothetical protein